MTVQKKISAWRCESCQQQNLGRTPDGKTKITACQYCGDPISENVKYYAPSPEIVITDETVLASLKAGEDSWFCGHCGSANTAPGTDGSSSCTCAKCGSSFKTTRWRKRAYRSSAPVTEDKLNTVNEAHLFVTDAKENRVYASEPNVVAYTARSGERPSESLRAAKNLAKETNKPVVVFESVRPKTLFDPTADQLRLGKLALGAVLSLAVGAACVFAALGIFYWLNRPPLTGVVDKFYWQSSLSVHGPVIFTKQNWESAVPASCLTKNCGPAPTGRYEQKPEQYVTGYEQTPEKYVSGYEQTQVFAGYNQKKECTPQPDSCGYESVETTAWESCEVFNDDGTYETSTCPVYGTEQEYVCEPQSDECEYVDDTSSPKYDYADDLSRPIYATRYVDDTTKPIYGTRYVDDLTKPVYASFCTYTIKEFPIVRVEQDSDYDKLPRVPKYVLGLEEYADASETNKYLVVTYSKPVSKESVRTQVTLPLAKDEDWGLLEVGSIVVMQESFGSVSYRLPTQKDLRRLGDAAAKGKK